MSNNPSKKSIAIVQDFVAVENLRFIITVIDCQTDYQLIISIRHDSGMGHIVQEQEL